MTNQIRTSLLILAAAGLLATGCSDTDNSSNLGVMRASLTKAVSCEQLESMIKTDALTKMNARIDSEIAIWDVWGYGGRPPVSASPGFDGAESGSSGTGGTAGSGTGSQEVASEFSGTNTQVDGVDEADIVKTDGKNIYLLHGQSFLVLNAWPSTELAQTSSFGIEGTPLEMYVTDEGKVVVYSTVDGTNAYQEAGISPRSSYNDGYHYDAWESGGAYPGYPGSTYNPLTKITVLQLNDTEPSVLSETYFEGSYRSSRRIGQHVRTVIEGASFGPNLRYGLNYDQYPQTKAEWVAAYEALRTENAAKINATTLADWLPYSMTRTDAGVQAHLAQCDEFYVPTAGTTTHGMTQIQSIDLAAPERMPRGTSIVGATDTVYSSHDTFVLAARAWVDPGVWQTAISEGDAVVEGPTTTGIIGQSRSALKSEPISTSYTHLHTFDLIADPGQPQYVASGSVPGRILNQFNLDVHNGYLRVATTDDRVNTDWENARVNHLFVLGAQGDMLEVVGSVRDLAPGERIYSARFMGDKGYLVTFRDVDPLFAIDLSNPTAPKVLGELKIPGFSEYMHPLGEDHLLTIGQDEGLALQIFDVTDPTNPLQKHKYVYTNQYGYSEAQTNHKAFTFYASHKLLAFPFVGYSHETYSSLELFDIDKDQGISLRGSVDHSGLFGNVDPYGYCGGYYGVQVRRGLFMEEFVYSISYGGVIVNHIDNLVDPVASLALNEPTNSYCSY